jgi:hypothetical protein
LFVEAVYVVPSPTTEYHRVLNNVEEVLLPQDVKGRTVPSDVFVALATDTTPEL